MCKQKSPPPFMQLGREKEKTTDNLLEFMLST